MEKVIRRVVLGAVVATAVLVLAAAHGTAKPPSIYVCGERLVLPAAAGSREGLSMAINARRSTANSGPDITVTFAADRTVQVISTGPTGFEVLYLKDGTIVGGGPMMNLAGDTTAQGTDQPRDRFSVAPGRPSVQSLGRRDWLCPPLRWDEVWSQPQRYEVVVVVGPVERTGQQVTLGFPAPLAASLLMSRGALSR